MGSILIKNGYIVTMNESLDTLYGDILIENDKIKKLESCIDSSEADVVISAKDKIVMPGFIQTHVHLCQTLFRNMANDLELMDWLNIIMPLESCHDSETAYISAKLAIAEMLRFGTTTINDMGTVGFADAAAQAVKDTGIRAQLGRTIMDSEWTPEYLRHDTEKGLQETEDFIKKWHNNPSCNITCGIPIRWVLNISDPSIIGVGEIARKYNIPIHTHANENIQECEVILQEKGMSTIEYFYKFGLMENKMQIAHCIWVSEQEKKIIKENNVSVLHCPSCNLKAASGIAPITEYLREGINISIGCDTAACNDNLDQFIEMKLAALMQKVNKGATSMPAQQTFALANIEGARALNLEKRIGSLEVGKQADIVILNRNLWNTPFHDHKIYSALIYSFNGRDVDTTIVNGKVLVREGKVTGFDIHELVKDAEAAIRKVTERAIKQGLYRG